MPFAEDNNVIKTIPSDRADEPLRIPFCDGEHAEIGRLEYPLLEHF
jgi:hypothetical protein